MKEKYLEELRERLEDYDISRDVMNDVLDDYAEMIDDAIARNMSEDEIYNLIGSPRQVVRELKDQLQGDEDDEHEDYTKSDNKLVALMPFITVIAYMIMGLGFQLWHPGWLVFLLIPVVAIIVNVFKRKRIMEGIVAISPFIVTITYLVIGFMYNLWHPTWILFLIIPILGVFTGAKKMKFLELITALSPFIATITYILIGFINGVWHPTWLIFLIIPVLGILNEKNIWKLVIYEASIIIPAAVYLYVGYKFDIWDYSLLVFLIPIGVTLILQDEKPWRADKEQRLIFYIFLVLAVIYFVFGFALNTWAYLWMIFLLAPMIAVYRNAKGKNMIVALMPFISVIVFFSVGYFFHLWEYSWIAFLSIPVTAIIKNT